MTAEQQLEDLSVWIEECPVRIWRKENNISIHKASSIIGVASSSIQTWEVGGTPRFDNFMKMITVMEEPDLVTKWRKWQLSKPQF